MNQTVSVKLAFGVVIFSVLSSLVIASIIAAAGTVQPNEHSQNTYNYIALFVGQGFMIIPLLLFLISRKEPIIHSLRLKLISAPILLSTICISMGLIPIVDEMDRILSFIFGTEEELAQLTDILIIDYSFIGLLLSTTIVVLAPLGEEILFRGFLQKKLEESWQDITRAILVTSLFFAFIHMNPVWIIQIYLLGVILGYLAWKTGSILTSLVLHSLNNGAALILTNYSESINPYYLWNNHVSPFILFLGICSLSFGFYNLNKSPQV
tara:strand:- start:242 stop:1039 length:798 start_codon:yes stop_codon:yes gene_type:complete